MSYQRAEQIFKIRKVKDLEDEKNASAFFEHPHSLSLPGSADIIREFWVYSKYGSLRFFRVEDSDFLEIGRDDLPLAARGESRGRKNPGRVEREHDVRIRDDTPDSHNPIPLPYLHYPALIPPLPYSASPEYQVVTIRETAKIFFEIEPFTDFNPRPVRRL